MKSLFAIAFVATAACGLLSPTSSLAQSGPTISFLCGAEASKKGLVPGSAARKAYIQRCVAGPQSDVKPQPPKPVPGPKIRPSSGNPARDSHNQTA